MPIRIRGAELAWDSAGVTTAPPLIWGHGLTSSRAGEDVFPIVDMARVREQATVIRYDAHGHGESSVLSDPERGSWHELALDQIELIEYLGVDQVILGGASMGTGTALHAAVELGDRVRGLLLAIPPTGWDERAAQVSMYEQMASIVDSKGVGPLVAASASLPPPDPFIDDEAWKQRRADSLRAADPERLAKNFRGAAHADLPSLDQLRGLAVPTLVLAWSGDTGHPVSTATILGETMPSCEVVISSTPAEFSTWTDRTIAFLNTLTA